MRPELVILTREVYWLTSTVMKCLLGGGRWLSWWSRSAPRWCLSSSSWAPPHRRPSWYNYTDRRAALGRHKQRARVPGNTEQLSDDTGHERAATETHELCRTRSAHDKTSWTTRSPTMLAVRRFPAPLGLGRSPLALFIASTVFMNRLYRSPPFVPLCSARKTVLSFCSQSHTHVAFSECFSL